MFSCPRGNPAALHVILALMVSMSVAAPAANASPQSWKKSLTEDHLGLKREPFGIWRASMLLLKELQPQLPQEVYVRKSLDIMQKLSLYMKMPISNPDQAQEILDFFADDSLPMAKRISALLLFMKFLMILATVLLIASVGFFLRDWVFPLLAPFAYLSILFLELPNSKKRFVVLPAALATLYIVFWVPLVLRPYIGLFSSLLVILATRFFFYPNGVTQEGDIFEEKSYLNTFATLSIFGAYAIGLDSSLIGFVTVVYLFVSLGFVAYAFTGCWMFGFRSREQVTWTTQIAGLILAGYVACVLVDFRPKYFQIFEAGIFFWSTFIYFLGLLIIEGSYHASAFSHILTIASGLACFFLGSLSADLSVFRAVGTTFFTLYIVEQLSVIRWGVYWSLGLFLGGAVLMGYAALVRHYWTVFI